MNKKLFFIGLLFPFFSFAMQTPRTLSKIASITKSICPGKRFLYSCPKYYNLSSHPLAIKSQNEISQQLKLKQIPAECMNWQSCEKNFNATALPFPKARKQLDDTFNQNDKKSFIIKIQGPLDEIQALIQSLSDYIKHIDSIDYKTYHNGNEFIRFVLINFDNILHDSTFERLNSFFTEEQIAENKIVTLNIKVNLPTMKERLRFFSGEISWKFSDDNIDLYKITALTDGFSNKDLNRLAERIKTGMQYNSCYQMEDVILTIQQMRTEKGLSELQLNDKE